MATVIRPAPLSQAVFEPFGDVLDCEGRTPRVINNGLTLKFAPLSTVQVEGQGIAGLSWYRSRPVSLPFPIRRLERHPRSSQAFIPLHPRPFPVVVALPVARPGARDIRVYITNGRQGVNLHPGTWHHHQLSFGEVSDYLVVERRDEADDVEWCEIAGGVLLQL